VLKKPETGEWKIERRRKNSSEKSQETEGVK
jgi:hypothetical protein